IKINNEFDIDFTILGLIDPDITVNVIENGKIKEKVNLELPATVTNIIKCTNPRCISSVENYFDHHFHLVDKTKRSYRCEFCDDIVIPYPNR
ncbi:MAG: aspartate carbamoyltransferase regulatory subunit, partial [Bacteroidales bacterium]|nr:aspartate carbamoyltransferase regulatory subunit [Bacteroidales bacterium]